MSPERSVTHASERTFSVHCIASGLSHREILPSTQSVHLFWSPDRVALNLPNRASFESPSVFRLRFRLTVFTVYGSSH
jgi:hypothetical protein